MAKTIKTGLIITGDAKGGVSALKLTEEQLKDLNKTNRKAAKQNKTTGVTFEQAAKKVTSYGTAAAAAAVAGVGLLVARQLDVIDSTAKVSDKLGISTEALTALRLQAELSGVATNTLDMAMQRMVRRLSEAAQGTGEARSALKELNLDAVELARLSPDKQFEAIAEKMKGVANQGDRVRLSFKLFDSEGVALVNTLEGGAAAAQEARDFVDEYGLAISRLDAAKIEAVNDKWHLAQKAVDGLATTLTVKLSTAMADAADDLRDFVKSIAEIINGPSIAKLNKDIAELESRIASSKGGRRGARHGTGGLPGRLAALRRELLLLKANSGDVNAITAVMAGLNAEIDDLQGASSSGSGRNKQGGKTRLAGLRAELAGMATLLKKSQDAVVKASEESSQSVAAATDEVKDNINTLPETLETTTGKMIATVERDAPKAANVYVGAWDRAVERVDDTFATAWEGAFDGFKSFGDSLVDSFKKLLAELAHLAITRPILIGLGFGGSGAAQAGGGSGSLLSAVSGGGGSGGFSVTDLLSNGKSLLNVNSGFDGLVNGLFEAGYQDAAVSLGNAGSSVASLGGGNLALGSLYTAGAGLAGSYAGNAVGEGVFGKEAESQIGATAGAAIGTFILPGIGTAIGAAIGSFIDVAFGGDGKKRSALGVRTAAGLPEIGHGQAQGASGLLFTGYSKRAGDQQGPEIAKQLVDQFLQIDAVLTNSIRALGGQVDLAGQSLVGKAHQAGKSGGDFFGSAQFNGIDGNAVSGAADEFVVAWLDAVSSTLPARTKGIFNAVNQDAQTLLGTAQSLGTIFATMKVKGSDLFDVLEDLDRTAAVTLLDNYRAQTTAAIDLAGAYDGSLSSLTAFESAMLSQRDTAFLVAAQIRQAQASIADIFGDARTGIRESLMTPEELYQSRRYQVSARVGHLSVASDPALIDSLSREIVSISNSAFNALDESQRAASGQEFLDLLNHAQSLAADRLAVTAGEVESGIDTIDTVFTASADRLIESANVQQQAAATFAAGVAEFGNIVEYMASLGLAEINI